MQIFRSVQFSDQEQLILSFFNYLVKLSYFLLNVANLCHDTLSTFSYASNPLSPIFNALISI